MTGPHTEAWHYYCSSLNQTLAETFGFPAVIFALPPLHSLAYSPGFEASIDIIKKEGAASFVLFALSS